MKAEIDKDGTLTITPGTECEAFALRKWWEHYGRGAKGARTTLVVGHEPESQLSGMWTPTHYSPPVTTLLTGTSTGSLTTNGSGL
jgi:hypothetical protein